MAKELVKVVAVALGRFVWLQAAHDVADYIKVRQPSLDHRVWNGKTPMESVFAGQPKLYFIRASDLVSQQLCHLRLLVATDVGQEQGGIFIFILT